MGLLLSLIVAKLVGTLQRFASSQPDVAAQARKVFTLQTLPSKLV